MGLARRLVGAAALATAVLATAGCGGDSASPQQAWADDLCTAVGDWQSKVESARDDAEAALTDLSAATPAELRGALDRGEQATRTLATELDGLGAPPGDDGAGAGAEVDRLAEGLRASVATVRQQVDRLRATPSPAEAVAVLAAVRAQVAATLAQARGALAALQARTGAMRDAFDRADSCEPYRAG